MADELLTLEGVPELLRKLDNPQWAYGPMGAFLDKWRFATQRQAVANFKRGRGGWVDSGGTRQSITSERDTTSPPLWAKVGSNKATARWGEYGTGLLSDDPESKHTRHWPPGDALEAWATRKHIPRRNPRPGQSKYLTGDDIAAIIGKRGGLRPRYFLRNAAEATQEKIPGYLKAMATEIEAEASRGTH